MKKLVNAALCTIMLMACGEKRTQQPIETAQSPSSLQIEWATFNVLCDYPGNNLNDWKYRKDSICQYILAKKMDIIGMQEVLHNQLEDMKAGLPNYAAIGVGREDGKEKGEYTPLFYRSDKYEVLESNTFWLSQYPDSAGFIGWDGACPRIATWAKFKDKSTGKIFMGVNTHFDHIGTEARRESALLIIKKIKEIVGDQPAVITGDFNVNDQSEAYQTITKNDFVLKDAYKMTDQKTGPDYTFHDFGRVAIEQREKIDFIFVTPQISVLNTEIAQNPETKTGYLSDHNPHMALLEF